MAGCIKLHKRCCPLLRRNPTKRAWQRRPTSCFPRLPTGQSRLPLVCPAGLSLISTKSFQLLFFSLLLLQFPCDSLLTTIPSKFIPQNPFNRNTHAPYISS